MTPQLTAGQYSYRIHWSADNGGYVASVAEFPSMQSPAAPTPHAAAEALLTAVVAKLQELDADGQPRPHALALS